MSIIKLLSNKPSRLLFTTPSHSQNNIFSNRYSTFYKEDFSEIEGFDNLSNPKNSIFMAQTRASQTPEIKFLSQEIAINAFIMAQF